MIAERIEKKKATNFKPLAAYVLAEQDGGRGDPVDWKLGDYLLDQAHAGEKVAWAHATNCESDDLGWAVKEILATQAQNKTAHTDKSYHLVVSFPVGERPTREQLEDIERELCAAIGLADHQRLAAVHQNTDNWHMHIAINRVHPTTLRAIEPYYDHYRLQEACVTLEVKHSLTRDNHSPNPERPLNGRAHEMEAHAGRISFSRWVAENAAVPVTERAASAGTWAALHAAFADYGLVIKPRGAGLIVANIADERGRMKASAIDRSLAFKPLTDRLGAYQPPAPTLPGKLPTMRYTGAPRGASPETARLWERYQQERDAALAARKAALDTLRAAHLRYTHELNAWYRQRYAAAKAAHLNRGDRIATRRTLDASRNADHARRREREKADRQKVKDASTVPSWAGFLMREGGRGDRAALRALERSAGAKIVSGAIEPAERDGGRA
jgi:hypothetical protein